MVQMRGSPIPLLDNWQKVRSYLLLNVPSCSEWSQHKKQERNKKQQEEKKKKKKKKKQGRIAGVRGIYAPRRRRLLQSWGVRSFLAMRWPVSIK